MKTFLLLLFILISGSFIYLKVQVLGDPNSGFNQTTRYTLGKYSIMRSILGMHSAGDARAEYLGGTGSIAVEIVRAQGTALSDQAMSDFANDVKIYIGRPVMLYTTDFVKEGLLTDADLEKIVSEHRHRDLPGQTSLFVIYAGDYVRKDGEVAKTYKDFGIVISDTALRDTTQDYSQSLEQYAQSTMLHELGHQLGLDHNTEDDCVMNAEVESPQLGGVFSGSFTPLEFCDFELKQLNAIKVLSR